KVWPALTVSVMEALAAWAPDVGTRAAATVAAVVRAASAKARYCGLVIGFRLFSNVGGRVGSRANGSGWRSGGLPPGTARRASVTGAAGRPLPAADVRNGVGRTCANLCPSKVEGRPHLVKATGNQAGSPVRIAVSSQGGER